MYDVFFFFKQKTAYDMRISDWSSDVCSSDLPTIALDHQNDQAPYARRRRATLRRDATAYTTPKTKPLRCAHHATAPNAGPAKVNRPCNKAQMPINTSAGARTNCRYRPNRNTTPRTEERRVGKEGGRTCRTQRDTYS